MAVHYDADAARSAARASKFTGRPDAGALMSVAEMLDERARLARERVASLAGRPPAARFLFES